MDKKKSESTFKCVILHLIDFRQFIAKFDYHKITQLMVKMTTFDEFIKQN